MQRTGLFVFSSLLGGGNDTLATSTPRQPAWRGCSSRLWCGEGAGYGYRLLAPPASPTDT
ncbi:hypothetical protein E2C01_073251 [Portunus trituberculatus]|uniref:Uncharacterized protein n=1 Tax=Portunus trituberculatus TaxID=210409 RepID=A0A5B7IDI4_PORTR|nr:hypothetical protein [Portunus trituberculatus]